MGSYDDEVVGRSLVKDHFDGVVSIY